MPALKLNLLNANYNSFCQHTFTTFGSEFKVLLCLEKFTSGFWILNSVSSTCRKARKVTFENQSSGKDLEKAVTFSSISIPKKVEN